MGGAQDFDFADENACKNGFEGNINMTTLTYKLLGLTGCTRVVALRLKSQLSTPVVYSVCHHTTPPFQQWDTGCVILACSKRYKDFAET